MHYASSLQANCNPTVHTSFQKILLVMNFSLSLGPVRHSEVGGSSTKNCLTELSVGMPLHTMHGIIENVNHQQSVSYYQ